MRAPPRVWVTRAEPGAARTAVRLTALGYEPVVAPLLAIHALPAASPDLSDVSALAFTSANGVAAFTAMVGAPDLPVFTVGDATADAARAAGFRRVRSANGAVADLASLLSAEAGGDGVVLAPGALQPAGDLAGLTGGAVRIRPLPVYEARETGVAAPPDVQTVLIHSPRAGQALARLGLEAVRGRLLAAISPAAAAPLLGLPARRLMVANAPTETELLRALGNPPPAV